MNNFILNMTNRVAYSYNFIQHDILEKIVREAFGNISSNSFVKKNLSIYIIQRQQQIMTNVNHQNSFIPNQCKSQEDVEAVALKEDNLMPVTQLQNDSNLTKIQKTVGNHSKKSSNGQLKARLATQKLQIPPYKSITKELKVNDIKNAEKEGMSNDVAGEYISRLRSHKQAEEKQKRQHPLTEVRKHKNKPMKGQKIVFDYDGNINKGKQLKNTHFDQQIISSSITNIAKMPPHRNESDRQTQNVTVLTKMLDRSVRNRTEPKQDLEASGRQRRESILTNLKLSNSKTKMIFDGHAITQQQQSQNATQKSQMAMPLKKRSSAKAPRINFNEQDTILQQKTDLLQAQFSLSMKQKQDRPQRSRINTEISERMRKQRINTQNESLKKVMMTEIEVGHFELPKNRIQRAITTNNNTLVGSIDDPDLLRIKERLNIKQNNQKLPKILSRYSNLEKDILREIRKKSKV